MTVKEQVKNNVLLAMRIYLDPVTMDILESVIVKEFHNVDMMEMENLPATTVDVNQQIIALFIATKEHKLSKKTMEFYLSTIKEFLTIVDKQLNKVDQMDIMYYLNEKRKRGNSNTSLNNLRRNLSAFYTWMRKKKLVQDNPVDDVEPYPEQKKPIEHLEAYEYEQLKTGCRTSRDRAMLEFLRCTAMRVGEVPQVRICDINFGAGSIEILGEKNGEYRNVMLDSVALKYIDRYVAERELQHDSKEYLFVTAKGKERKQLSADGIYCAVKTIAKRSELKKNVYPHLFRKTCATNIVRRGGSDELAGEYLGHTPNTVTGRHYVSKSPEHIAEIFNKYVRAI